MRNLAFIFASLLGLPAGAQTAEINDFWVFWERSVPTLGECATGQDCAQSLYFGHYIDGMDTNQAQRFFDGLGRFASTPRNTNIRLGQSPVCLGPQPEALPDATQLALAERVETLRGLDGVYIDLRGVRGPQSARGSFGDKAQAFMLEVFARHDIPILTKKEAAARPGNPVLSMRYSAELNGCRPWSVTLSLSQRVLLARAPTIMLQTTTWSSSARQDESNADFLEDNAMQQVLLAFAQSWSEMNDPNWAEASGSN
ncbi:MAG: hypothetical protein AAGA47_11765 [Pseudomonadota bacterium]